MIKIDVLDSPEAKCGITVKPEESRRNQPFIDSTSMPEGKMCVGGVRSTQDER
jgi:hypothetical protein